MSKLALAEKKLPTGVRMLPEGTTPDGMNDRIRRARTETAKRVGLADLETQGQWLFGRLRQRRPWLTERTFPAWVRGWIMGSEYLFIRTAGAIGLAQTYQEPLDPETRVRELFVYVVDAEIDDGATIYENIFHWARGLGVQHIRVLADSDVPLNIVREILGPVKSRGVHEVVLD